MFTPSRRVGGKRVVCYDDRFIVKLAFESDGIMVSNDTYRDLQGERQEWKRFIEERLLMYSFVNDKYALPPPCHHARGLRRPGLGRPCWGAMALGPGSSESRVDMAPLRRGQARTEGFLICGVEQESGGRRRSAPPRGPLWFLLHSSDQRPAGAALASGPHLSQPPAQEWPQKQPRPCGLGPPPLCQDYATQSPAAQTPVVLGFLGFFNGRTCNIWKFPG